jgi:hypothetical protein
MDPGLERLVNADLLIIIGICPGCNGDDEHHCAELECPMWKLVGCHRAHYEDTFLLPRGCPN